MKRFASLLLLALSGCFAPILGPDACELGTVVDPLEDIDVQSARFDLDGLSHDEVVEGHVEGSGTVVVIDKDGGEHDFAATITGTITGAGIDSSTIGAASFPFRLPDGASINARDLLGEYTGAHFGVGVGAGAEYVDLANEAGVHLNVATLSQGFGVDAGSLEDVTIALDDDPKHVEGGLDLDLGIDWPPEHHGSSTSSTDCPATDGGFCGGDDECCATETCLEGGCATTCGAVSVDDAGVVHVYKEPDGFVPTCPNGNTCQAYSATADGAVLAVACLPRTLARGADCFDIYDDSDGGGACANGLDCRPTAQGPDGYTRFTCEQPCVDDADCAAGETCAASTVAMPDGTTPSACVQQQQP